MSTQLRQVVTRTLEQAVGWLFLLAGVAILAVLVLTPPWLQVHELTWRRELLTEQSRRLAEEEQAYDQFIEAIQARDSVLLQRLAFYQLRQKPVGTVVMPLFETDIHGLAVERTTANQLAASAPVEMVPVETWLHRPMPQIGLDFLPFQPVESMLVELTTGRWRSLLLAVGWALILLGLLSNGRNPSRLRRALRPDDLSPISGSV